MPKATIFEATAPDGSKHYRTSISRTYTHAILINLGGAWSVSCWAGRPDLAEKAAAMERSTCANYASGKYGIACGTDEEKAARRAAYAAATVIAAPATIVERKPKATAP